MGWKLILDYGFVARSNRQRRVEFYFVFPRERDRSVGRANRDLQARYRLGTTAGFIPIYPRYLLHALLPKGVSNDDDWAIPFDFKLELRVTLVK